MVKKQYVWLVRYGKTEFPLVENDGPFNSDIDPTEGIHHAQCIANQIASSIRSNNVQVYSSPFLRCVHTASIIANKLQTKINIEEGLYEWLVPSLLVDRSNVRTYPQTISELHERFENTIDDSYQSSNPYHVDESNKNFSFPESEMQLLSRCKDTFHSILESGKTCYRSNSEEGSGVNEHIIIIAHAPCVQSIAYAMEEDVHDVKDSKLSQWPLGGITRFSREVESSDGLIGLDNEEKKMELESFKWNMDFYGLTDHMPDEYKNGAGLWSLSCFEK